MHIDLVTIFPELVNPHLDASLLGKAIAKGSISVKVHDLREKGLGAHRSVDDAPYGGGAGMVMRPEPIFETVEPLQTRDSYTVLLSPRGTLFRHEVAQRLSELDHLILICGRYEGVDERVAEHLCDEEISIGDFVLAGGEVAALAVVEAVTRLVPGVVGNPMSLDSESHAAGLLEYPQYTRPAEYRGWSVPDVLVSGNHAEVARWRRERSRALTAARRPDLAKE
ncbi:MAG: tRNA (guanosine(37)-N1)-methyltransferase TrmD [Actinomycetota bacterium]|nr:tRNA (guanosine(37)-N1)-methyltransferase TrmD [Actinomycetota bacterium]